MVWKATRSVTAFVPLDYKLYKQIAWAKNVQTTDGLSSGLILGMTERTD